MTLPGLAVYHRLTLILHNPDHGVRVLRDHRTAGITGRSRFGIPLGAAVPVPGRLDPGSIRCHRAGFPGPWFQVWGRRWRSGRGSFERRMKSAGGRKARKGGRDCRSGRSRCRINPLPEGLMASDEAARVPDQPVDPTCELHSVMSEYIVTNI